MTKVSHFTADDMALGAEAAAEVMRALSNPSRLMLLCKLVEGDSTVRELELALGLSQAYVSQQLARLRESGLVEAKRDGRAMHYRLSDSRVKPVLETLYAQFCPNPEASNDRD